MRENKEQPQEKESRLVKAWKHVPQGLLDVCLQQIGNLEDTAETFHWRVRDSYVSLKK